MRGPFNSEMENDDRRFHRGYVNDEGVAVEGTDKTDFLNMLLDEFSSLMSVAELDFDDDDNTQLKGTMNKLFLNLSEKLMLDISDKVNPVGTIVYSAMNLEQFSREKSPNQVWVCADGSEVPEDSKFFKLGLGYINDKDTNDNSRYLPDARRYLRAPESQNDLKLNKGFLNDAVNPSSLTLVDGNVSTNVGFNNSELSLSNSKTRILMQFAKPSSAGNGQNIMFNYFASQVLAGPAGNQMPYGLYGEVQPVSVNDPSPHVYSQTSFIDRDGHNHTVNIPDKRFSGTIDSISFKGESETRPKTQLINAFVRIN